jgi:hypothetical protein
MDKDVAVRDQSSDTALVGVTHGLGVSSDLCMLNDIMSDYIRFHIEAGRV